MIPYQLLEIEQVEPNGKFRLMVYQPPGRFGIGHPGSDVVGVSGGGGSGNGLGYVVLGEF